MLQCEVYGFAEDPAHTHTHIHTHTTTTQHRHHHHRPVYNALYRCDFGPFLRDYGIALVRAPNSFGTATRRLPWHTPSISPTLPPSHTPTSRSPPTLPRTLSHLKVPTTQTTWVPSHTREQRLVALAPLLDRARQRPRPRCGGGERVRANTHEILPQV